MKKVDCLQLLGLNQFCQKFYFLLHKKISQSPAILTEAT